VRVGQQPVIMKQKGLGTSGSGHVISLRGITKRFAHVVANDGVDLDIRPGEVHALLGENGAGKSTLMKILYGFYHMDSGSILIDGTEVRIASPLDARALGIGMVFQSFTLIPAMTVAENVAMYFKDQPFALNLKSIAGRVRELGATYHLMVDPSASVRSLSVSDQQKVEILKLLVGGARVLIFDEATSVLAQHEISGFFEILQRLKADEYSIIFITHKLAEVMTCADRITVMRKGKVAGTLMRAETTEQNLVKLMFDEGLQPSNTARSDQATTAQHEPLMELQGVSTRPKGIGIQLVDVSLHVNAGEIVGIAGVSGNGQRELVDVVLGIAPPMQGKRLILGEDATAWNAGQIREKGVGFVPDEPVRMALVPWMTLCQNSAIGNLDAYVRAHGFSIDWLAVEKDIAASFEALGFEPLPLHMPVQRFSGGQIQRSVLAREIGRKPRLLVAFYPTRGLDVRSAEAVGSVLTRLRNEGGGVLLVSEDLDELVSLCDRLVVIRQGRIVGSVCHDAIDRHAIGYMMTGSEVSR